MDSRSLLPAPLARRAVSGLPIAGLLAAALGVGGCSVPEPPAPTAVIVVGLDNDPTNLDPRRATDAASSRILDLVCEGLVRLDAAGRPLPGLARSWETPDDRTVIFRLHPDRRFSDGSALDAGDVVATIRSILDERTGSPHRGAYRLVERIEVEDPTTVRIELRETFAPVLGAFTRGILSAEQLARNDASPSSAPVCSGPYRVEEAISGDRVVLVANEHAAVAPVTPRIVFRVITDETTRFHELRKGTVHVLLNGVAPDRVPRLRSLTDRFRVVERPSANATYLSFNLEDPLLADLRVRRAIAHAIDRETIVETLLAGGATLATGILPPTSWARTEDVRTYDHDPDRARALLDEAGHPDPDGPAGPAPRFRLTQKTSQSKLRLQIAEVFRSQLAEVGIDLSVRSHEWGTFFDDVKRGRFQLYALTWVGLTEPDILHHVFHSSSFPPEGANRGRYRNERVDALTVAGRSTLDVDRRREIYAEIQQVLAEELPYVFLWHENHVAITAAGLEGFELTPTGELSSLARARWVGTEVG